MHRLLAVVVLVVVVVLVLLLLLLLLFFLLFLFLLLLLLWSLHCCCCAVVVVVVVVVEEVVVVEVVEGGGGAVAIVVVVAAAAAAAVRLSKQMHGQCTNHTHTIAVEDAVVIAAADLAIGAVASFQASTFDLAHLLCCGLFFLSLCSSFSSRWRKFPQSSCWRTAHRARACVGARSRPRRTGMAADDEV